MVFESEQTVNLVDQFYNALDLILDLLRSHKDMGIVLSKAAHTHQAVKLAGFLMAVYQSQLSHPDAADPGRNGAQTGIQAYRPGSSSV